MLENGLFIIEFKKGEVFSMSTYTFPKAGLGNVGSYQASAIPFLTSSLAVPGSASAPLVVEFPTVTRFVTVKNDGAEELRFGFSAAGVAGTNYYTVATGSEFQAEWKVTRIYLLSNTATATSASLAAGLTGIEKTALTTNWSGSLGVG